MKKDVFKSLKALDFSLVIVCCFLLCFAFCAVSVGVSAVRAKKYEIREKAIIEKSIIKTELAKKKAYDSGYKDGTKAVINSSIGIIRVNNAEYNFRRYVDSMNR